MPTLNHAFTYYKYGVFIVLSTTPCQTLTNKKGVAAKRQPLDSLIQNSYFRIISFLVADCSSVSN